MYAALRQVAYELRWTGVPGAARCEDPDTPAFDLALARHWESSTPLERVAWYSSLCSHLGVQVVIEDYVGGSLRVVSMVASQFAHVVLAGIGIVAILKVAFGGSA